MATFSVIVPVYNAAKTVERCVDSLYKSGGENLQIILIEDSSKDHSWEVCQRLAAKYETVTALHNEHNSGVSHARNKGLNAATGEYLLFCDSDDYWEEGYVATRQYEKGVRTIVCTPFCFSAGKTCFMEGTPWHRFIF